MKKYLITLLIGLTFAGTANAQFSILRPNQGGTGIGSVTAGDVGNCLQVLDDAPFTWTIATCGSGGGGASGVLSTTTPLANTQVVFSTGVASIGNDSAFTWNSTADRLTFTYASTTGWTSSYASSTLGLFGTLTAPLANITKLTNLTSNGFVKTSGSDGTLSIDTNSYLTGSGAGVTAVSVASANGFAGSSSGGATPALTLTTSITGMLKGNGTAISAASNGTDFTLISATTCGGTDKVSAISASGAVTCSTDQTSAGGSSAFEIATTSTISLSQLSYFTQTTGRTTLGGVSTTTLVAGSGVSFGGATPVILGSSPITISATGGGGSGTVSTSTNEVAGRLSYWTSNSGTPALLGQVSTTTLSLSGFPASIPNTLGTLVGGSNTTWTWWGLATTSQPSSSNLLVSNGGQGVYGVATSTPTVTAPITYSGTLGSFVGGVGGTFGCTTATGAVAGCLSTTNWNTFNNKIGTSTAPTLGHIAYWGGTATTPALSSVATSSLAVGASISSSGTLGSQIGGTASSLSLNMANPNVWTALQSFSYSSSTAFSTFKDIDFITTNNTDNWIYWGGQKFISASSTKFNTSIGMGALDAVTSGQENVAVGYGALTNSTSGNANTAIGKDALAAQVSGIGNTAVGLSALSSNVSGAYNTAFGWDTLKNSTGNFNTAFGTDGLLSLLGGGNNTTLGIQAGRALTTGSNNTFIGMNAGYRDETSGYAADGTILTPVGITDATAIGYNAQVQISNGFVLGGTNRNGVYVGVGTTTPRFQFQISSSTAPQMTFSDGVNNHWSFRNAGGSLYIATSSPTTFATSSASALSIDSNGKVRANCFTTDGSTCISGGGLSSYDAWTHPAVGYSATTSALTISSTATSTFAGRLSVGTTSTATLGSATFTVKGLMSTVLQIFTSAGTKIMDITDSVVTLLGTWDFSNATVKQHTYATFAYSTSTAWTATTTIPLGVAFTAESYSSVKCYTDTGTVNVSFYDGTNRMNMFNASSTVGTVILSTNNTFTASEKVYVDIGTPASSPTKLSCTTDRIVNN